MDFGEWRRASVREDVEWGATTSTSSSATGEDCSPPGPSEEAAMSLSDYGRLVLETPDPLTKAKITHEACKRFAGAPNVDVGAGPPGLPEDPARPEVPPLVPPRLCPSPKASGLSLSAYMIHNLAHIELNAIDLAWDTVVTFSSSSLPQDFYLDFLRVADDESRHLRWCLQRLAELDSHYGAMPSHDLLWQACKHTRDDLVGRLVAIPMVQEARGLDAGPRLVNKLEGAGDSRSAAIVAKIAQEEKAHVAVGVYWFHYLCSRRGAGDGLSEEDRAAEFQRVAARYCEDMIRGPFDVEAREAVGLLTEWFFPLAKQRQSRG